MSGDNGTCPLDNDSSDVPCPEEEVGQEEHRHRLSELFPRCGLFIEFPPKGCWAVCIHICIAPQSGGPVKKPECNPPSRNLGSLFSTTPELLRKERREQLGCRKLAVAGVGDGADLDLERMKVGLPCPTPWQQTQSATKVVP